jgi:hypothetical protein
MKTTTIKTDDKGTIELISYDEALEWRNRLQDDYIKIGNDYAVYPSVNDDLETITELLLNAPEDEQRMIIHMLVSEISRGLCHLKTWMDKFNKDNGCDKPITSFYYDR